MNKFETWQIILGMLTLIAGPALGSYFGLRSQLIFELFTQKNSSDTSKKESDDTTKELQYLIGRCEKNSQNLEKIALITSDMRELFQQINSTILKTNNTQERILDIIREHSDLIKNIKTQ